MSNKKAPEKEAVCVSHDAEGSEQTSDDEQSSLLLLER